MAGFLIVLSSPSGGGKTTIIHKIMEADKQKYVYSVSATTRAPRAGEVNGVDYFFLSKAEFFRLVKQKQFLEWEEVHGYYYGTNLKFINDSIKKGKHVLLDLDVNGALKVAQQHHGKTITIFIAPPSMEELVKRLQQRRTDAEEEISKRLARIPMEMERSKEFDFVVINENLDEIVTNVINIIEKAGG